MSWQADCSKISRAMSQAPFCISAFKSLTRSTIFFLIATGARVVLAQADFSYEVFDETKTDRVNFEFGQDLTVYDFGDVEGCPKGPRVHFSTQYRIYGVAEPSFSYTEERFDKHVPRQPYEIFLQSIRRQPLNKLDTNPGKLQHGATSPGWIKLDDREIRMSAPRGNPDRESVHALVMGFYDGIAPLIDRTITRRTIEGDFVPPRLVSLKELLSNPKEFDGKRIRLSGYYHHEYHCSNLTLDPKSRRDPKQGVWIDSASTYADSKRFDETNDAYVNVEGCFTAGPGGAWGSWPGSIERVTEFRARHKSSKNQ